MPVKCKEQVIRVCVKDLERMILASGEEDVAEYVDGGDGLSVARVLGLEDAPQLLLGGRRRRQRRLLLIRQVQRVSLRISLILLLIKTTYATRRSRPHVRPPVCRRKVPVDLPALRVRLQAQEVYPARETSCHDLITGELDVRYAVAVRGIGLINTLKITSCALPKLQPTVGTPNHDQIVDEVERPDWRCVVGL